MFPHVERRPLLKKQVVFAAVIMTFSAGFLSADPPELTDYPYEFSGTVSLNQDYQHEIPGGLVFILEFIEYGSEGWAVRIFDPAFDDDNFCAVVTPPYHGVNALQIYTQQFYAEEDGNEGFPNTAGEERGFYFVTDKASYDTAFESLSAILWPENSEAMEAATIVHDGIHRECGSILIKDLIPGGTGPDSVWIESIEFEVKLFIRQ